MAYADSIRTANYTREELATLIEGVRVVDTAWINDSANISTSSTSLVTTSTSVTVTVAAGQKVFVTYNMIGSIAIASGYGTLQGRMYQNGASSGFISYQLTDYSSTSGSVMSVTDMILYESPSTGSVTYTLYYAISSGPTNGYSTNRTISAMVFEAA